MTVVAKSNQPGFQEVAPRADVRPTILVVDDERELLVAMEDLLGGDYRVITASSGKEALEISQGEPDITVVLSDQRMPSMAGDELLSRLNATSDASRILVTGFADLSAVVRAVNEGKLFAYLSKPWDESTLRLTVQRAAQHCLIHRELLKERTLFRDLMDSIPDGVYVKDRTLTLTRANRVYLDMLRQLGAAPGNEPDSAENVTALRLNLGAIDMRLPEQRVLGNGQTSRDVVCQSQAHGPTRYYSTSHAPLRGSGGRVEGVVGVIRDVTERRAEEGRLLRLARVRKLMSAANGAMVRTRGRAALLERCCRIAVEHGQLAMAGVLTCLGDGRSVELAASATESAGVDAELEPALLELGAYFTSTWLPKSGGPLVSNSAADLSRLPGGARLAQSGLAAIVLLPTYSEDELDCVYALASRSPDFFDVEEVSLLLELTSNLAFALEHEANSARLHFVTSYDQVTGLARRGLFAERLRQRFLSQSLVGSRLGILWVDVARFRHVNETLGRATGDELLRMIGERLKDSAGDAQVARFDANAFGLMSPPCEEEAEIAAFLESTVNEAFRKPFLIRGRELRLSCTVGISVCPGDGEDPDRLMAHAETACKAAKLKSQPALFYAAHMDYKVSERLDLESKLRAALELDQFVLHYQPKVHSKTGVIVGLEGLIRWRAEGGDLVPPGVFLPVLEETGLILQVGAWVLRDAARQYESWRAQGLEPPRIAVNVSAIQLENPGFVDSVLETFAHYPAARDGIDLEITESAVMGDFEANQKKLQVLQSAGFHIAIDDFGTGYSSLAYLSRLPVNALKVDRSFVDKMCQNPQDMSIVTTIISLAHGLDLKVIAEGVETTEQARMLALLKCDQLQGYLFSRPRSVDEITEVLAARECLAEKIHSKAAPTER